MTTTKFVRRVAEGTDGPVHLVRTAHWEGSIDGNPYGLCSQKVPVAAQDEELVGDDAELCPKCKLLSDGIPLPVETPELAEGEVSTEDLAIVMADTTGRSDEEILAELAAAREAVSAESAAKRTRKPKATADASNEDVAAAENEGLATPEGE